MKAVAVDLDALGDTRPLWRDFLSDSARRFAAISPLDPDALPEDRAAAARALDRWAEAGVGDWRIALERFAEDRAPVYLRPSAEASAALRALAANGVRIGVYTDAPSRWPGSRWPTSGPSGVSRPSRPARARGSGSCERLGSAAEIVATREQLAKISSDGL